MFSSQADRCSFKTIDCRPLNRQRRTHNSNGSRRKKDFRTRHIHCTILWSRSSRIGLQREREPQAHHPSPDIPEASDAYTNLSRNNSFEASLFNRIKALQNKNSIFIQWDGNYLDDVKNNLQSQVTQKEYNLKLEFESRELQLRELRDQAASLLKIELSRHQQILEENTGTHINDSLFDFFDDLTQKIEKSFGHDDNRKKKILMIDNIEMARLSHIIKDLKEKGSTSSTFRKIVESYFSSEKV